MRRKGGKKKERIKKKKKEKEIIARHASNRIILDFLPSIPAFFFFALSSTDRNQHLSFSFFFRSKKF